MKALALIVTWVISTWAHTQDYTGCGGDLRGSGVIQYPEAPRVKYDNNEYCKWTVSVEDGYVVDLNVESFDLEGPDNDMCIYDRLLIRDISTDESTSKQTTIWCGKKSPFNFVSSTSTIEIEFKSDEAVTAGGFNITFGRNVSTSCRKISSGIHGTITLELPTTNSTGIVCEWVLIAPEGQFIDLTFTSFNLTSNVDGSCGLDYTEVFDVMGNNSLIRRGHWCGKHAPPEMKSFGRKLLVILHTDNTNKYDHSPIQAEWTAGEPCGGEIEAKQGYVMSYNYPDDVDVIKGTKCSWSINVPEQYHIDIRFVFPPSVHNCHDAISIIDFMGDGFGSHKIQPCGSRYELHSITNKIDVEYKANISNIFSATWESVCGREIWEPSGNLTSPNYNNVYGNDMDCGWIIHNRNNCIISLEFDDFDIEDSEGCVYDYVEIFSLMVKNETRYSRGKFCGNKRPPPLTSYLPWLEVVFHSDKVRNGRGFKFSWNTECPCGDVFTSNEGSLVFPEAPVEFYRPVNCTWAIRLDPYLHSVRFMVDKLDIRQEDSLKISAKFLSDTYNEVMLTPGVQTMESVDTDAPINVTFVTSRHNWMTNGTGFNLTWNGECRRIFRDANGTFSSPKQGTGYLPKLDCEWVIEGQKNKYVHLSFLSFDLEAGQNGDCPYDYVQVIGTTPGKNETDSPKICGHKLPKNQTDSNRLVVRFHTDRWKSGAGFKAKFHIACGRTYREESGNITSPNYPKNYDDNLDCTWMIQVKEHQQIILNFKPKFHIQKNGDNCPDSIEVYDGGDRKQKSDLPNCGSAPPPDFRSNSSKLLLVFKSDSEKNGVGFSVTWRAVCGQDTKSPNGTFTSLGFPDPYPNNQDCEWTMSVGQGNRIELNFHDFDLEPDPEQCRYDFVEVFGHFSNGTRLSMGKWCGQRLPTSLISFNSKLTVAFHSDNDKVRKGFKASWRTVTICGGTFNQDQGHLMSPDYPSNYPNDLFCEWNIRPPGGANTTLVFHPLFDVEDGGGGCQYDFIEVFSGSSMAGKYCGPRAPSPVTLNGNNITIKFISDKSTDGSFKGFFLSWAPVV